MTRRYTIEDVVTLPKCEGCGRTEDEDGNPLESPDDYCEACHAEEAECYADRADICRTFL